MGGSIVTAAAIFAWRGQHLDGAGAWGLALAAVIFGVGAFQVLRLAVDEAIARQIRDLRAASSSSSGAL